jgi:putative spermidine/putrescine transport system ATP-binding protein
VRSGVACSAIIWPAAPDGASVHSLTVVMGDCVASGTERVEIGRESVEIPRIQLSGLRKTFGAVVAVDGVDLDVSAGEFFAMLGPSGSGKTTVLRMIAGFEEPTAGTVRLSGVDVTREPPFRRDVNTVFQDYALFPHMTVAQNIGYGMRVRGIDRAARRRRTDEALEMVRLPGFGERRPSQLSGGQRQRVALARALVNRPQVLLLDEPLGALDLKLREQMQIELKAIQREIGITFMFVTHDQDEALTLSDRLAVFNAGRIEQVGTPRVVYEQPATAFVAGFVGTSNVLAGASAQQVYREAGTFAIRPERITVSEAAPEGGQSCAGGEVRVTGSIRELVYAGAETRVLVELDTGDTVVAVRHNVAEDGRHALRRGQQVWLSWSRRQAVSLGS